MKELSRHRHCEQCAVGSELVPVPMVASRIRLLPGPLLRLRTHLSPAYQHSHYVPVLHGHLERSLLGMEDHIVLHSLTGPACKAVRELVQKVVCDEWYQAKISCRITWEVARVEAGAAGGVVFESADVLFIKNPVVADGAIGAFP